MEKSVGPCVTAEKKKKNFPRPSELLSKHTSALSAFMFIQLLASGTSQQNSSVCKFNLWAITSNRRLFCRHDSGVCQSACPYGLIGILSKHKGMMGELWSKCPCPVVPSICCGKPQIYWAGLTAGQQNSSLKNTAPSLSATDLYSEHNKHFRNEGMCAFVPASCSLSVYIWIYVLCVYCLVHSKSS